MNTDLILQNVARHIELGKEEVDYFVSLLSTRIVRKKDFLLKAGDICYFEHFINKGCLRTYSVDENGFEHIIMFATEDWWTGDLYSFLTQSPASFHIDALEDTELLQISRQKLEELYQKVPRFERFFRIMLQNAFIAQQQRIHQNLSFTAEERYFHFLEKFPGIEQRVPQKQVAAYLGITPEFLSVLRRKRTNR